MYTFSIIKVNNYTKEISNYNQKFFISDIDDYIEDCIKTIKKADCYFKFQINKHKNIDNDESEIVKEFIVDKDYEHKTFN